MKGPGASQPLEFSFLEHTQQLGLKLQRNIADLVEEYRTAVRQLEAADALCNGASERAFLVSEQLAFEQACRYSRAVELDEGVRAAKAEIVDRARDQFFSRPRLAVDEHGRIGGRHGLDLF